MFDNGATIFFAVFMSLWAALVLEFWKRRTNKLAFRWDVRDLLLTEPQRPRFMGLALKPNPVTGVNERWFPSARRMRRIVASVIVLVLMLALVILSVLGVIIFRLAVRQALFDSKEPSVRNASGGVTSACAAVLSLIIIVVLAIVYEKLAFVLTEWGNKKEKKERKEKKSGKEKSNKNRKRKEKKNQQKESIGF